MSRPTIQEVFAEFAPIVDAPCCLAGGCVRDALHGVEPRDFDLFCFEPPDSYALRENYQVIPAKGKGYDASFCTSYSWRGEVVQVIRKPWVTTPLALTDGFDWAICQWWFDGESIRQHPDAQRIVIGDYLRLNNPWRPAKALARGRDFADRFWMLLHPDDEAMLLERIEAQEQLTNDMSRGRHHGPRLKVAA